MLPPADSPQVAYLQMSRSDESDKVSWIQAGYATHYSASSPHSDKTEAAFLRGDLFDWRRELMDTWASYACAVKGDKVVAIRQSSA